MSVVTSVPNIDVHLESKDVHIISPQAVSYQQVVSNNYSINQASFTCPPPSKETFIDRCVFLALPVTAQITMQNNPNSLDLFSGSNLALRAYPGASIINNSQVTVESQSYSLQVSDLIPAMAHFWAQEHDSTFPDFLDTYSQYSDAVGAINNPLGSYGNSVSQVMPRGAFPMIVSTTSTQITVQTVIFEPVWSPIFSKTFDSDLGLTNIQTLNVVLNFNSNLGRVLSYVPPGGLLVSSATITSLTVNQPSLTAMGITAPSLFFKYSTPPHGYVPRPLEYRADRIDYWITQTNSTLTGGLNAAITPLTATNIQLGCIPDTLLLFVRESNQIISQSDGGGVGMTDTAAVITDVNITFDNLTGQVSTANEQELYSISKENMLQSTWEQYHGWSYKNGVAVGTQGSFLCLKFGKDITLAPGKFPGELGQFNLQVTVGVKPVLTLQQPSLFIVAFTPEKLILKPNGCEKILGLSPLSSSAHGEGGAVEHISWEQAKNHFGAGRSFGSHRHHLMHSLKHLQPLAHEVVASSLGGSSRRMRKGHGDPCEDEGGKVMTKEELVSRIKSL